ncbi:MAG: hypothetical protein QF893_11690 [Alphaproteobacteria bacterium]|jgi:hypothetical protein|nr:hypothetical protein [Alphaproteobacteria bacterium]
MTIRGAIAGGLALLVLIHVAILAVGRQPLAERGLSGPDSYTRMVQVGELWRSGEWHQATLPRSNTPFGEPRVWTRAFDIVLLAGALVMTPAVGFDTALHLWALLVGPLLHLAALAALLWAVAPLLGVEALVYLAVLFPFQVSVTAQFMSGRPDHHALQALLFVVLVGLGIRLLADVARRSVVALAALAAAAALWVSVEGLLVVGLVFAALGLAWTGRGLAVARRGLGFAALLAAALIVVLAIERPPARWPAADYDRLSAVHLWLVVLVAGAWLVALAGEAWARIVIPPGWRVVLAVALIGAVAAAMWLVFPAFFGGPMVAVPPEVLALWQQHISEFRPALDRASLANSLHLILVFLGPALPALLYLPFLVRRAEPSARRGWLLLGLAQAVYLPLSLYQLRWGIYAELLSLPIYARILQDLAAVLLRPAIAAPVRGLSKAALVLLFALGPVSLGWLARPAPAPDVAGASVQFCDIRAVSAYLMRPDTYGDRPRRLLTYIFDGPELLYRTHHSVVATPDHANAEGIADTLAFFAAADPEAARTVAAKRGIELLLLCPAERESRQYLREGEASLLARLIAGAPPPWLAPMPLPGTLGDDYLLFEVRL